MQTPTPPPNTPSDRTRRRAFLVTTFAPLAAAVASLPPATARAQRMGASIGPGLGIGVSSGFARPATPAPTIRYGAVQVDAGLSPEVARRVLRRNAAQLRYCYERALQELPGVAANVQLRLTVAADGRVVQATVDPPAEGERRAGVLATCLVQRAQTWSFPTLTGAPRALVVQPLAFAPAPPADRVGGSRM